MWRKRKTLERLDDRETTNKEKERGKKTKRILESVHFSKLKAFCASDHTQPYNTDTPYTA